MVVSKKRHAELALARYHQRRLAMIDQLGGKCAKCGALDDLEIDHIDPSRKELSISKMWSYPIDKLTMELAKCQVLCNDCHKEKTAEQKAVPHGGGKSGKHGCKCDPCRLKKNEYLKLLKRQRRASGLKN